MGELEFREEEKRISGGGDYILPWRKRRAIRRIMMIL